MSPAGYKYRELLTHELAEAAPQPECSVDHGLEIGVRRTLGDSLNDRHKRPGVLQNEHLGRLARLGEHTRERTC